MRVLPTQIEIRSETDAGDREWLLGKLGELESAMAAVNPAGGRKYVERRRAVSLPRRWRPRWRS